MTLAPPISGTYAEATAELFALQGRGMKLGLENIRALLDDMGSPDRGYRILHVAGTNGKGSTASYLAAGLRACGLRTGLFTSPHLVDFRERVGVDGDPIAEAEVVPVWAEIRAEVERRNMTFFEANTAIALRHFANRGCDVVVLETGMGGRLDSTTATQPAICVLTRIALDHREYLGRTLEKIAGEKAAILRGRAPGFSAPQERAAEHAIRERAADVGSALTFVGEPQAVRVDATGTEFRWRGVGVRLRMVGRHQAQNALLALEALAAFLPHVPPRRLAEALEAVEVPGRFQRVERARGPLVLDVGHNPDALGSFAGTMDQLYPARPKRLFVAMLRDKDLQGSLSLLARGDGVSPPLLVGSASTAPDNRRLRREDWLALPDRIRSRTLWVDGIEEGLALLDRWQAETPGGVTAVIGSFTSVGEAMGIFGLDPLRDRARPAT